MSAIYPDLKNKNIFITGASRGIGLEIAKSLAAQGAGVFFNSRKGLDEISKLEAVFKEAGATQTKGLHFDLTERERMDSEFKNLFDSGVTLQGLVNNAGVSKDQLILKLKEEDIAYILDINLKGTINLTAVLSKHFLRQKEVSIVHMSSVVGLMGNKSQSVYAASKAGLIGFSKSIAKELASRKIRSNVICPGFIQTEMTEALSDKVKELYQAQIPMGEFGGSTEVANLTNFLLSSASGYITGEVIKVDGGLYC